MILAKFIGDVVETEYQSAMQVNVDKDRFDTTNFMSIMAAINATAQSKAPMEFFVRLGLAPVVDHYVKQALIIQKENKFSVNVNYTQGELNINGNVISL